MESQVRGGTRWKRFAVVMVPSVAATAAIGVAMAQGALAASFSVSGQSFKVTAKELRGEGFTQYGALTEGYTLTGDKVHHPVAVSSFSEAHIEKMCQSVVTPNIPVIGSVTLRLEAGNSPKEEEQVYAKNLQLDVEKLEADATFTGMEIGVAAGDLSKGPGMQGGKEQSNRFGFAQQSDLAVLKDVKQTAWATTAGTFKLPNLSMSLHKGTDRECY
ncbi:DUF6230 family protein [Streptomyces sp. NPDC017260]|uniref:DUF6230 family protein n=1 Tax=unclassified Streptomyces TaxID=2593676 RepID=UPI003791A964